jgi:hypothetical protein
MLAVSLNCNEVDDVTVKIKDSLVDVKLFEVVSRKLSISEVELFHEGT